MLGVEGLGFMVQFRVWFGRSGFRYGLGGRWL